MATVSTLAEVKRALLDEIQNLAIASATAASPTSVQVEYARPPIDQLRSEAVYFGSESRTVESDDERQRLQAGRRMRYLTWEFDLVVSTSILADAEEAEKRNFVIVAAVESFLADYPQPADWPTTAVSSGAMSVVLGALEVDQHESPEGFRTVETTITLMMNERLT